ncbi:hypothetical protein HZA33_04895 [Candidatus Pacearchaeota archaeon]|nr:hypothetical protein [Candidatus Pacearchaeota archaeon]
MPVSDFLIFLGGFLGTLCSLLVKYGVQNKEFRKVGNYVVAVVLSAAVYGIYFYLKNSDLLPSFHLLALFGFALFIGFALEQIARTFVSLIKRSD